MARHRFSGGVGSGTSDSAAAKASRANFTRAAHACKGTRGLRKFHSCMRSHITRRHRGRRSARRAA